MAPALGDDAEDGDIARSRLLGEQITAPDLIDLEVASVFRRQLLAGDLDVRRAQLALTDLIAFPIRRVPHRRLLTRCWDLRANLTVYDAVYVALAELLDLPLITGDGRLSRAPGLRCQVEVLGRG